jgi:ABC-type multidrug transport system fused ATPase/permease subunit
LAQDLPEAIVSHRFEPTDAGSAVLIPRRRRSSTARYAVEIANQPIAELTEVARELNVVGAAADRIAHLIDRPAPLDERDDVVPPAEPIEPEIHFDHVAFRYGDHLPLAVDDVTCRIRRDLPLATVRDLITFVPQDTYLFHGTLRDNVRLGRLTASQLIA